MNCFCLYYNVMSNDRPFISALTGIDGVGLFLHIALTIDSYLSKCVCLVRHLTRLFNWKVMLLHDLYIKIVHYISTFESFISLIH